MKKNKKENILPGCEDEYRDIVNHVNSIILKMDLSGHIVFINDFGLDFFGYRHEELIGRNVLGTIVPEYDSSGTNMYEIIAEILQYPKLYQIYENENIRKSGELVWISWTNRPVYGDDGEIEYILSVGNDITKYKLKELADKESGINMTRMLLDIIRFLPDATFVIDKNSRVIAWNNEMENLTGVKKEDMIGKGDYEYAIPFYGYRRPIIIDMLFDNYNEYKSKYDNVSFENDSIIAEVFIDSQYITRKEFHFWGKASLLYNESGEVIGAIESIRDISSYKRIEQELIASEEKFRLLFEQSADAQFLMNNRIFIDCNRAAVELFELKSGNEIVGLDADNFLPAPQPGAVVSIDEIISNAMVNGSTKYERLHKKKNGSEIYLNVTLTAITIKGEIIFHGLWKDITEQKMIEKEILEISIREQQKIGKSLHDDLGQLLTGTGFLCESLMKKMSRMSFPEMGQVEKIHKLIQDAKELTRALARGLFPVDIYVGGLIAAVSRLLRDYRQIFNKSISFSYDSYIQTDHAVELQLYYIIQESVINAIQHGKAENVSIKLYNENNRLRLLINDDGIGISKLTDQVKGMGIRIMMYRAKSINASLSITNNKEGGTSVSCIR